MRITRIGVAATIVLTSCGGGDETPVEPVVSTTTTTIDLDDLFREVEIEDEIAETVDVADDEPTDTDPVSTDPVITDPVSTDPVSTDPTLTDSVIGDSASGS